MHARIARPAPAVSVGVLIALLLTMLPAAPGPLAGLLGPVTASAATSLFSLQSLGTMADQSRAVATGDLDNDGDMDVLVGNGHHGYFEDVKPVDASVVYLNSSFGTFTATDLPLYNGKFHPTTSVALGDVNGDGFLDAVLGGAIYSRVGDDAYGYVNSRDGVTSTSLIYLNDGRGGFQAPTLLHESVPTTSVALGDIDGDGALDIVTANYNYPLLVYKNIGDGRFAPPIDDLGTSYAQSVALGHLDGDGRLDIVVGNGYVGLANTPAPSQVYFSSDGPKWFSEPKTLNLGAVYGTNAIALGDLDGDGRLDIVLGNSGGFGGGDDCGDCVARTASVIVYNNGNRDFSAEKTITDPALAGTVRALALGDVNGDELLDVVTGNGRGPYGANETAYKREPMRVYLNQRDDDGKPGAFSEAQTVVLSEATNILGLALADLNGDSTLDIVTADPVNADPLFINTGGIGLVAEAQVGLAGWQEQNLAGRRIVFGTLLSGDLDGDGWLDLIASGQQKLWVALNDQQGQFPATSDLNVDSATVAGGAVGDMNGDSRLDLVLAGTAGNKSMVLLNQGGSFGAPPEFGVPQEFGTATTRNASVALGDLDSDGNLDVVVGSWAKGEGAIYLNNGAGVLAAVPQPQAPGGPETWSTPNIWTSDVALGDFDSDGDLDVAASGYNNYIFANNGVGRLTLRNTLPLSGLARLFFDGALGVAVGDVNGDGNPDVAFATADEQNAVYLNDGTGGFRNRGPFFGPSVTAHDVSFADMNGDKYIDIITSRLGSDLLVHLNNGGGEFVTTVQPKGEGTGNIRHVVGDFDRDGALDVAQMYNLDGQGEQRVVRTVRNLSNSTGLNLPKLSAVRPGLTDNAGLYSTAEIQGSPVIPVSFTLSDPESDPVRAVRAEFSIDGGGTWQEARPAADAVLTDLATSPNGVGYIFPWDTFASGFFGLSDSVAFRLTAAVSVQPRENGAAGPYQRTSVSATTNLFRVRGTQVRVLAPDGNPARDAVVFRLPKDQESDGSLLARNDGAPYRTDAQGYLPGRGALAFGEQLIALQPVETTEKFTRYLTSAPIGPNGPALFTVERPGVQQLQVLNSNALLAINLSVSLEWDASNDPAYLAQLESDLQRSSELLYRWSDGQIALGSIAIYQDKEHWSDADVQIAVNNTLRPNANQGGIVRSTTEDSGKPGLVYEPGQIRMGATWNRFGEANGQAGEDWPRAFAHELGHWALFLDEDYLGFDAGRNLISVEGCPSPMGDPYRDDYAQFRADTPAACASTLNQQVSGRSNWATIKTFYDTASWSLTAPASFEPDSGPKVLPFNLTSVRREPRASQGTTLDRPIFSLRNPDGTRYLAGGSAQGMLFRGDRVNPLEQSADRLTNLGLPERGEINARGAREGDRLCVFDETFLGCQTITASNTHLVMRERKTWAPELLVTPVTSRTFQIAVGNVDPNLDLKARLYAGEGANSPIVALDSDGSTAANGTTTYRATVNLSEPILSGLLHVWVDEGAQRREAVSDYALGGNPAPPRKPKQRKGRNAPALSPDGQVVLFSDNLNFAENSYFAIQRLTTMPLALPAWSEAVGLGYRLLTSANAPSLLGTSINIGYLEQDVVAGTEAGMAMYYLPEGGSRWVRLSSRLDTIHNEISAKAQGPGFYVLASSLGLRNGWNMLSYPWPRPTMPVTEALDLLNAFPSFRTMYGYDETDHADPWKVYAEDVPAYVNDLSGVRYGQGYWVYAELSAAAQRPLLTEEAALASLPYPPATYYTTAASNARFPLKVGQRVQAFVDGALCAETTTREAHDGQETLVAFVIDVPAATDEATAHCGLLGRAVTFTVDGVPYNVHMSWENSHPHSLDVQRNAVYLPLVARNLPANTVDLKVLGVEIVPAVPVAGRPAEVRVTVTNSGTQPIARSFWVDLYLDPETPPESGDIWPDLSEFGATWRVYGLGVGETVVLSTLRPDDPLAPGATYSNFRGFGSAGQHELYVRADTFGPDGAGTIDEGDEENNLLGPRTVAVRAE